MSVLEQYPDPIDNNKELQIWNNAAFDDFEGSNFNNIIKSPSCSKKPVFKNPSFDSFDSLDSSFSSKENQSPSGLLKSPVLVKVHESRPLKNLLVLSKRNAGWDREKPIDEEIKQIENEIGRLTARLESLRLVKATENLEKQGKSKDSVIKKIEESGFTRTKIQRRGFSLGPNEIMSSTNSKSKQSGPTPTPIQSAKNNRRKSCFWKLEDIEEGRIGIRQAVTTVGSRKGMRKEDSILSSIEPKRLFGDKSVPGKKPVKSGRVIPSRYNQPTVNSSMRKRSLPDNNDRRGSECRVKKKWEIPNEIVVAKRLDLDKNENNENGNGFVLPRIRAVRCVNETPRDSGAAKRVAELVGKRSYFGCVEEEEETVCQKLSFDFEEEA